MVYVKIKARVEILCEGNFQNLSRKKKGMLWLQKETVIASVMPEGEIQDPVGSRGMVGCRAGWRRRR